MSTILSVPLSLLVTVFVGYFLIKRNNATVVLLIGGVVLIICSTYLPGHLPILGKSATGITVLDTIELVRSMFSKRISGLGLQIMLISGYAAYMRSVGADQVLADLFAKPIRKINAPWLTFAAAFILTQGIGIFVPSGSGAILVCMVSVYPILIGAGLSRLTSLVVICSSRMFGLGPLSPNANFAASLLNIDVVEYFVLYQLPIAGFTMGVVIVCNVLIQKYYDSKEPDAPTDAISSPNNLSNNASTSSVCALLPLIPLSLVLFTNPLFTRYFGYSCPFRISISNAVLLSLAVAVLFDILNKRSLTRAIEHAQVFFVAMGKSFACVVCLIVAGEIFAKGLLLTGSIDALIQCAKDAQIGAKSLISLSSFVTLLFGALMGSGNAPFFSFAHLMPNLASSMDVNPTILVCILDEFSMYGRNMSPIFGGLVAAAGIAGVSPFAIARRTFYPSIIAGITALLFSFVYFDL